MIDLIERDKEHRRLALNASQSFIVQAPAGSGKTELLIQRFLTLLNHVKNPEEILAITFTKKAANEMRSRVIRALKQALSDPEPHSSHAHLTWTIAKKVLQRDQQFQWNIIQNPNQLRIQTIDSLCAYLTRQLPLLSHFGSQPDIAENSTSLYQEAVQEVLTHVEENFQWSNAISHLLLHLDNDINKLHDLLVSLLAKRDQWLSYIQFNTNDKEIKKQLENHLSLVIIDCLKNIADLFPKEMIPELMAIARFAADNLAVTHPESALLACRNLTDLPKTTPHEKQAWLGLATLLLTKSHSWRKRVDEEIGFMPLNQIRNPHEKMLRVEYQQRLNALIVKLSEREDVRLALAELHFLPEPYYKEAQWEILQSLLQVLKITAAQLRVTFEQHGQIDFIENAQAALVALGNDENPTDLALALDYQIKHLLIDEFQDTSLTQYQLLEKLTVGWDNSGDRTLFIVGDPMQSIYRFREAEVGLFIRMQKYGIGAIQLTPLVLSINFRSSKNIVDWNNHHFQKIFPSFNDMGSGAITYHPSISNQTIVQENESSAIHIHGFLSAEDSAQATHIISLIKNIQSHQPSDNIAILVRSRTHLTSLIPALKKAKLPYHAVDIDPLVSRQIIQDLFSLTCALLHPADRIAWLAVLRAPWCGLTLADLIVIGNENPNITLWEQLERPEIIERLSDAGKRRLTTLLPLFKKKIAERERYYLREWIESTWLLLGGPACLQNAADMDDVNSFFSLLENFNQHNQFINLNKLKSKIDQLYASTTQSDATIQIMTIHTAKGLEFDTVILPHLERKMPHDDKSLLLWMERPLTNNQSALLLAPIHATGNDKDSLYEYINRQRKIKADYETDRLFYVAATRAKKNLYFYFDISQQNTEKLKIEAGSFLEKLWPFIEHKRQDIIFADPLPDKPENNKKNRYIMRLDPAWENPIIDTREISVAVHQKQNGFFLPDNKLIFIGIVVHRVLQYISQHGFSWWQQVDKNHQLKYLVNQFIQLGLNEDRDEAALISHQAIENTLNDTRGKWILHPHHQARSEFAISAIVEGKIENLIIDRTFIDEEGIRWIIDYKTAGFSHENSDDFLEKEQQKYIKKMQLYRQAMQLMDDKPIRLGLYFPVLSAWRELL